MRILIFLHIRRVNNYTISVLEYEEEAKNSKNQFKISNLNK